MSGAESDPGAAFADLDGVMNAVEDENSASDDDAVDETKSDAGNESEKDEKSTQKVGKRKLSTEDWKTSDKEQVLMDALFGNKDRLLQNLAKNEKDNGEKTEGPIIKRQPAWHDSDDEDILVAEAPLYKSVENKDGVKYQEVLKRKFERIVGQPEWADLDKPVEYDSDEETLRTIGHIVQSTQAALPKSTVRIKRLKDLNRATYCEGPGITAVQMHPSSSVALVTGGRGIACVYSIDGTKNEKLHSIEFQNYAVKCCRLSVSGSEALFGSTTNFFHSYDLLTGESQRCLLAKGVTRMDRFEMSPCGKLIAVAGRFGELHLLNAKSKELIRTLRQNSRVSAMSFSADANRLYCHSNDSEVTVFDVRQNSLLHRWTDEGCITGTAVSVSPSGAFVATGSAEGVVNIYECESTLKSSTPTPTKTVMNLRTSISDVAFNCTDEMLAMCSSDVKDAVKLVHMASGTVFSNFPGNEPKIGYPRVLAFSPGSGYLAIGTAGKEVPLFRLKHYKNY